MKLGKMKEVDLRSVWVHEQYDFSKWLAEDENIKALGEVLNLSLTDVETEQFVGSYRCDIICKDELTGNSVLIENQLEQTNHDHLGKIITYASGLDAGVVVWIVASAKDEHASAIEWLNKHTDDNISFFLFLWRSESTPLRIIAFLVLTKIFRANKLKMFFNIIIEMAKETTLATCKASFIYSVLYFDVDITSRARQHMTSA